MMKDHHDKQRVCSVGIVSSFNGFVGRGKTIKASGHRERRTVSRVGFCLKQTHPCELGEMDRGQESRGG
jgi:hypothetical protein